MFFIPVTVCFFTCTNVPKAPKTRGHPNYYFMIIIHASKVLRQCNCLKNYQNGVILKSCYLNILKLNQIHTT